MSFKKQKTKTFKISISWLHRYSNHKAERPVSHHKIQGYLWKSDTYMNISVKAEYIINYLLDIKLTNK